MLPETSKQHYHPALIISIYLNTVILSDIMSIKVSPLELIDQLIMLIQLLKLQTIGIILIQHLERQSRLFITHLLHHFLQHCLELGNC